ncbi:hypothetical protein HYPSUDRAFT_206789 [Hypholoma sublateritium FD-334 SS-4]|uniref:Uncharacterized protein n=1 Tax=Hypholoma sublateritium (strain FD-334 SS-4) TaxID=945553 RepID=A0A0D2NJQ4_HYPSF|nr:hypothetical protein HYPSUDRAFT_206789 [Hypholoma sublateritium FD-334 SS-4]
MDEFSRRIGVKNTTLEMKVEEDNLVVGVVGVAAAPREVVETKEMEEEMAEKVEIEKAVEMEEMEEKEEMEEMEEMVEMEMEKVEEMEEAPEEEVEGVGLEVVVGEAEADVVGELGEEEMGMGTAVMTLAARTQSQLVDAGAPEEVYGGGDFAMPTGIVAVVVGF